MKRFSAGLLAVVVIVRCPGAPMLADEPRLPRHLAQAEELVRNLELKHTTYEHGKVEIKWTPTRESHADCSGFIDELLKHSYGYDAAQFKRWFGSHRPSAKRYHDAILEQHGFRAIDRLPQVRPGDILAVKYLKRKDNTGHVMLVAGEPRRMPPKPPLVEGAIQWEAPIIDSSETGHGPSDTRHHKGPGGKDHPGLGAGVLRIYADQEGKILGFTWSTLEHSEFKAPDEEHLVAGRLVEGFEP